MSRKSKKYKDSTAPDSVIEIQESTIRTTAKQLQIHEVLTEQWLVIATEIGKLSNFSTNEQIVNTQNSETSAAGKHEIGTLWDCRDSVVTLRVIVEENKVGTLLALIRDYKVWVKTDHTLRDQAECAERHSKSLEDIENKTFQFEIDVGMLLSKLFEFSEALQSVDIVVLLNYVYIQMLYLDNLTSIYEYSQEVLVWNYLYQIFRYAESLDSDCIVSVAKELELPKTAVTFYLNHHERMSRSVNLMILEALGAMANSEDLVDECSFVQNDAQKHQLIELRQGLIREIIVEFPDRRPYIRPFLDIIDQYEKAIRFSKK